MVTVTKNKQAHIPCSCACNGCWEVQAAIPKPFPSAPQSPLQLLLILSLSDSQVGCLCGMCSFKQGSWGSSVCFLHEIPNSWQRFITGDFASTFSSLLRFCNDWKCSWLSYSSSRWIKLLKKAGLAINPSLQLLGFTTPQWRITDICVVIGPRGYFCCAVL